MYYYFYIYCIHSPLSSLLLFIQAFYYHWNVPEMCYTFFLFFGPSCLLVLYLALLLFILCYIYSHKSVLFSNVFQSLNDKIKLSLSLMSVHFMICVQASTLSSTIPSIWNVYLEYRPAGQWMSTIHYLAWRKPYSICLIIGTDSLGVPPVLMCLSGCTCSAPSRVRSRRPLHPPEPLPQHHLQLQLAAAVGSAGLHLRPLPHSRLVPVSGFWQAGEHAHPVCGGKWSLFVTHLAKTQTGGVKSDYMHCVSLSYNIWAIRNI